jgi:hypothetical protein
MVPARLQWEQTILQMTALIMRKVQPSECCCTMAEQQGTLQAELDNILVYNSFY